MSFDKLFLVHTVKKCLADQKDTFDPSYAIVFDVQKPNLILGATQIVVLPTQRKDEVFFHNLRELTFIENGEAQASVLAVENPEFYAFLLEVQHEDQHYVLTLIADFEVNEA